MKVKVDILGSLSLISLMVSVDVKQHRNETSPGRARELCKQGGWWAFALIPYSILLPSLTNHAVPVQVKHHERKKSPGTLRHSSPVWTGHPYTPPQRQQENSS